MRTAGPQAPPEMWGGIECTINRVGERYFDQLEWAGHYDRLDDLDRIAGLGIRALRFPILWERVAPNGIAAADWRWTDAALNRLRELGIRPIATLVHHGSGPRTTHLLDDAFAPGLAAFAAAVAERYPWLERFTPVNEPLTTARFSALYGHWYPHLRDMTACLRALLNETRATMLAMQAIRNVVPNAELVQTEDIGKVHSTPHLRYQADFENERRWLSLDLLCGRVDDRHPLWGFLRSSGIREPELAPFASRPCPPDLLGINYYVTSERFIDERFDHYPVSTHGGNGRDVYADVEVVRTPAGIAGLETVVRETAARYDLPIAVTEVHLGGSRCEQMRWIGEAWEAARAVRRDGIDLRALTVWALLGSSNWHRLVTVDDGHYEPGAFDVRSGVPRPTALAAMIQDLAARRTHDHPALAAPGWWRRNERVLYGELADREVAQRRDHDRTVLVMALRPHVAEPLLRRLRARRLSGMFALPTSLMTDAKPQWGNVWAIVVIAPTLSARQIEGLNALVRELAGTLTAVVTADGSDIDIGSSLVIELGNGSADRVRHSRDSFPDELSPGLWDDVIDLVIDGAHGRWSVTDDGALRGPREPAEFSNGSVGAGREPGSAPEAIVAGGSLDGLHDFR